MQDEDAASDCRHDQVTERHAEQCAASGLAAHDKSSATGFGHPWRSVLLDVRVVNAVRVKLGISFFVDMFNRPECISRRPQSFSVSFTLKAITARQDAC